MLKSYEIKTDCYRPIYPTYLHKQYEQIGQFVNRLHKTFICFVIENKKQKEEEEKKKKDKLLFCVYL